MVSKVLLFLLICLSSTQVLSNNILRKWKRNLLTNPYLLQSSPDSGALWFKQTLDHFHPTDSRTWNQRYFINDSFYEGPGGPIFLMIGGEGPANPIWMTTGSWIDYAKEHKALCFQLEHRYYGESHPTEDLSVKNLVYLTSTQALADLATFIDAMNSAYNLTGPWIAFGGSYPGSLAAWLRLKYPHLVHGSVSTSGPLIAQADFPEYLEVVDNAIELTSPQCNKLVKQSMKQASKLTLHRMGWNLMSRLFKTCGPFDGTDPKDVSNIMESLIGNFEDVIQYNKDNRGFEGSATANITIDVLCSMMTESSNGNPIERLAKVNLFMLESYNQECLDYNYQKMIQEMSQTSWASSAGVGGRQWTYQTCTEFGWYQSSNQPGHPFTDMFNVTFFENQCKDIFGVNFDLDLLDRGIARTNVLYGAKHIQETNVVYVHGSFDPWHALGITEDNGPNKAILIPGTAHCANMYPASENDPPQLKNARIQIGKLIAEWLNAF